MPTTKNITLPSTASWPERRRRMWLAGIALLVVGAVLCWVQDARDVAFAAGVADRVVRDSHATSATGRAIALMSYVRTHVTHKGAAYSDSDRPFLRATASDTLRTGRGYCGEATRAFIVMARSQGLDAQRINLYFSGGDGHTVAEVRLENGEELIVDAFDQPLVLGLEPLDSVMNRPNVRDYSTLNLRRLHLSWLFRRTKLELGLVTRIAESPYAILAVAFAAAAVALLAVGLARSAARAWLRANGWVHISSGALQARDRASIETTASHGPSAE